MRRRRSIVSSGSNLDESHKLDMLLLVITATFFTCNLADVINRILGILNVEFATYQEYVMIPFSDLFLSIYASTNTIYFCFFGSKFRALFFSLFSPSWGKVVVQEMELIAV